jgi:hypothetical protein
MSEIPHNDRERDAGLTAIYRAAAQEAPPAALDAAILAAARREVGARPRPAGFSFGHPWRASLSIAAVIVLSVSVVTLIREEAPEFVAPPRADSPATDTKLKSAASADDSAPTGDRGFVREERRSKNIGLKPPQPASSSGQGMRQPEFVAQSPRAKKDAVMDRPQPDPAEPLDLAKRRDAASDAVATRENKVVPSVERQSRAAEFDAQREIAQAPAAPPPRIAESATGAIAGAPAENKAQVGQAAVSADRVEPASSSRAQAIDAPARQTVEARPAPMAKPAPSPAPRPMVAPQAKPVFPAVAMSKLESSGDLAPEKWLERIEELRKLGRFEEAKASFAEFRKRYPDYRLPDALRDWAKP